MKDGIQKQASRRRMDPSELKTIQDFYVKYSLSTAEGVSEVASVGGFVKEYQV